LIFLAKHNK